MESVVTPATHLLFVFFVCAVGASMLLEDYPELPTITGPGVTPKRTNPPLSTP